MRPGRRSYCSAQGVITVTSSSYLHGTRTWVPLTAAFIGCLAAAGSLAADESLTENPYAPAYGHAHRHRPVPTRDAAQRMRDWEASRPAAPRPQRSQTLPTGGA